MGECRSDHVGVSRMFVRGGVFHADADKERGRANECFL